MASGRKALLVTYTMAEPAAVVGVFFRALRLSRELRRRDWTCVICNYGPIPSDPKVEQARREMEILVYERTDPAGDFSSALALFRRIDPQVILFGEHPLPFMAPLFRACRALVAPPLLMLEQYYNPEAGELLDGVDYLLMYGVRSMWPDQTLRHRAFAIVPPFIDRVTPRDQLPVPAASADRPAITVVGFDQGVLRMGIEILARIRDHGAIGITVSHDPEAADRMLAEAGVPPDTRVALPLQADETLFGLIAASRAVILANGFMQMMEALALGCPAVCVHRGIGMDGFQLNPAFRPLVSFAEDADAGARQVREWLRESPFTAEQRALLARERGGVTVTVDFIERAVARPRFVSRLQRRMAEWRRVAGLVLPARKARANEIA
jgi:hypothetical protein